MSGAILLTGATGFLGMETLAQLIERGEEDVLVLIRAEDEDGARARLADLMARLYEHPPPAAARVAALRGDLLEPRLGLSGDGRRRVVDSVDRIVHCAASISFELPLEQAREINVGGVAGVIELAREIAAAGRLRRLVHVSTAYVGGRHKGCFGEVDLDVSQEFRNTYERSKFEAEGLVREASELPSVIARPSIVMGHSESGWTPVFNVLYWPMRAVERGLLREVPARPDSVVDFVPVDYVARALLVLLDEADIDGTFNLVAGELALSASELVELHAALLDRPPLAFVVHTHGIPRTAEPLLPYFDVRGVFDDSRARCLLRGTGVIKPRPQDYLAQLIAYAHWSRWGKLSMSREAATRSYPRPPLMKTGCG